MDAFVENYSEIKNININYIIRKILQKNASFSRIRKHLQAHSTDIILFTVTDFSFNIKMPYE